MVLINAGITVASELAALIEIFKSGHAIPTDKLLDESCCPGEDCCVP